jgi:hypothetical protein
MPQLTLNTFVVEPTKKCTKCKQHKTLDNFHKDSSRGDGLSYICKDCKREKERKHRLLNHDRLKTVSSNYYQTHKESVRKAHKIYYDAHRDYFITLRSKRYLNNKEHELKKCKEYRESNRSRISIYHKNYRQSEHGHLTRDRHKAKRRELGINPINTFFHGAHYHHLRYDANGNKDNDIGIYIPSELHVSVSHNGVTGRGMEEINKLAIAWYLENCPITPDTFQLLGFDNWNDFYLRYKDVDVSSYTNQI